MRSGVSIGTVALWVLLAPSVMAQNPTTQNPDGREWLIVVRFADGSTELYPGGQLYARTDSREDCEQFLEQVRAAQPAAPNAIAECVESSKLDAWFNEHAPNPSPQK